MASSGSWRSIGVNDRLGSTSPVTRIVLPRQQHRDKRKVEERTENSLGVVPMTVTPGHVSSTPRKPP